METRNISVKRIEEFLRDELPAGVYTMSEIRARILEYFGVAGHDEVLAYYILTEKVGAHEMDMREGIVRSLRGRNTALELGPDFLISKG